jgi:error-prone DNA polymerase
MLGIRGRVQREGEVVHLVAHHLTDLTPLLASVGHREAGFPLPHGRGDELHHGSPRPDPRGAAKTPAPRNLGDSYGHIKEIRVPTRDFR